MLQRHLQLAHDDLKNSGRSYTLVITTPTGATFEHLFDDGFLFNEFCVTLKPRFHEISTDSQAISLRVPILMYGHKHDLGMYFVYEHCPESGHIHLHGLLWSKHRHQFPAFKQWSTRKFGRTTIYDIAKETTIVGRKRYYGIDERLEYFHKNLDDNGQCENGMIPVSNTPNIVMSSSGKDNMYLLKPLVTKKLTGHKMEYIPVPDDDPFFD